VFPQTFFAGWALPIFQFMIGRTPKQAPKKRWLLAVHTFSMHKPAAVI